METQLRKQNTVLLLCGILGCLLMGGSDWLMIYGEPDFEGNLAWLTVGAAQIAPWRNRLAMVLAFPAVIFYSIALFGVKSFIQEQCRRRRYSGLTAVGLTPWLCLHLFYIMILYLFAWFCSNGQEAVGHAASEALFRHFSWMIPVGEAIMILPFCYLFYITVSGKSIFSRWMALNNPLLIFVALKILTILMPDSAFKLAFTNGLMSESMAVWFLLLMGGTLHMRKKSADRQSGKDVLSCKSAGPD